MSAISCFTSGSPRLPNLFGGEGLGVRGPED